jgi:hypothetical protein
VLSSVGDFLIFGFALFFFLFLMFFHMILIFLFFDLLFKYWCVFFVLVVVLNNIFAGFFLVLYYGLLQVMSIVLYSRVFAFVFGEFFVLFCVILFVMLFFGFWMFFSLLFGSIENTLPLIVIGVRRDSI